MTQKVKSANVQRKRLTLMVDPELDKQFRHVCVEWGLSLSDGAETAFRLLAQIAERQKAKEQA